MKNVKELEKMFTLKIINLNNFQYDVITNEYNEDDCVIISYLKDFLNNNCNEYLKSYKVTINKDLITFYNKIY